MHLICPQCLNAITLTDAPAAGDVTCPACGSAFPAAPTGSTGAFNGDGRPHRRPFRGARRDRLGRLRHGLQGPRPRTGSRRRLESPPAPAGRRAANTWSRFLREARSAARLATPAIVPIHEVGQHDGAPYLVSEFVQGTTLADLLAPAGRACASAAELIARLAEALQYAHERGVVHRDVKPSNILLAEDGTAFLTGLRLGQARRGREHDDPGGPDAGHAGLHGPGAGPRRGAPVDGRSDVYSLGVMLYQLLTGELPFRGNTRMLLHQVLHDEPRPPRKLTIRSRAIWRRSVSRRWPRSRARRYPKAGELAEDLRRFLHGEPVRADRWDGWNGRPAGRSETRR